MTVLHPSSQSTLTGRRGALLFAWAAVTAVLAWLLLFRRDAPEATMLALAALLVLSLLLVWALPNPIPFSAAAGPTHRGRFALLILLAVGVLFPPVLLVGPPLLFALPVLALIALVWLRFPLNRRQVLYAAGLALVAGIAGLGARWIDAFPLSVWAVLQVALTFAGLLAGWAVLKHFGLDLCGIGRSRFLSQGTLSALHGFGQGALLALTWSLGLILMGAYRSETWVQSWWQPFIAIQPGIAEEAWGRILLVPLLFVLFRLAARPRTAFTAALLLGAYWFAYLHTSGDLTAIDDTLITGTLFALPVTYLCLFRDLETAIGFHFWLDFAKFIFVLLPWS